MEYTCSVTGWPSLDFFKNIFYSWFFCKKNNKKNSNSWKCSSFRVFVWPIVKQFSFYANLDVETTWNLHTRERMSFPAFGDWTRVRINVIRSNKICKPHWWHHILGDLTMIYSVSPMDQSPDQWRCTWAKTAVLFIGDWWWGRYCSKIGHPLFLFHTNIHDWISWIIDVRVWRDWSCLYKQNLGPQLEDHDVEAHHPNRNGSPRCALFFLMLHLSRPPLCVRRALVLCKSV